MAPSPLRSLPRPGWRFWLGFAALVWCALAGAAVAGAAWGVGELQQATRFRATGDTGRDDAKFADIDRRISTIEARQLDVRERLRVVEHLQEDSRKEKK